ncbi:MAG: sulfite exporter TauE/SafE family protein, partial [Candidatus Freyarchaeota archaeon]|nr:sulfite exporter TauE/SafE family protein [Candidatus Jordarchaeia archaeon]
AIGTSTLIMAITATSGAIGYSLNGNINLIIAVIVGAGTILGGRVGAIYANRATEETLAKIVGIIFMVLGVAMIITQLIQ